MTQEANFEIALHRILYLSCQYAAVGYGEKVPSGFVDIYEIAVAALNEAYLERNNKG